MTVELDLSDAVIEQPTVKADRLRLITNQKKIWIDRVGNTHTVNLISIRYVKNLRAYLLRNSGLYLESYLWRAFLGAPYPRGEVAQDAVESAIAELEEMKPKTWMKHQPLYRQLLLREWRWRRKHDPT